MYSLSLVPGIMYSVPGLFYNPDKVRALGQSDLPHVSDWITSS